MGTSRSTAELVSKINKAAAGIPKANRQTIKTAAQVGVEVMTAGVVAAGGPKPGRPFPHEKRNGQAGTSSWRADFRLRDSAANPSAYLAYKGPVHWIEAGTKAHAIMSRANRMRFGRNLKKGPNARQQQYGAALLGFLTGAGGAGESAGGRMAIGNSPGGHDGNVRRGIANHKGSPARPFWQVTKAKVIKATTTTAKANHTRNLLEAFK